VGAIALPPERAAALLRRHGACGDVTEEAVYDPFTDLLHMVYRLMYDSLHKQFAGTISITVADGKECLGAHGFGILEGHMLKVHATTATQPKEKAALHSMMAILGPPMHAVPIYVACVNHEEYMATDTEVSSASCTMLCFAPLTKLVHEKPGILVGLMLTVHAITATQLTVDGPTRDGED